MISGVLVVDKATGPTSRRVLDLARRALGERKAGHLGTLDPFATGVLPILLGRATRLARFLSGGDTTYDGVIRLGAASDTLDRTGTILEDAVREVDLVGRLSADTFGVVLPNTHVTGAITAAERVWRSVGGRTFVHEERTARLTCSVGIAFFPAKGIRAPDDLLRRGREALYRAKQEGRNRICLYQAAHYLYEPSPTDEKSEGDESHGGP